MKIRRTSTAEAIVEHLIEKIREGHYGPGDRLPSERQMQTQLGVGRLSLREGLARLCALGIIRIDHGKGAFVQERLNGDSLAHVLLPSFPGRDEKSLEDFVNARGLIEGELTALAAARRTDADIETLRQILETPNVDNLDNSSLAEVDLAFHMEIARIADNEFLSVMLRALRTHIQDFLMHYAHAIKNPERVIKRHLPILQAIVDRDTEQARQVARAHVEVCKSSLQTYVEAQKNNGRKFAKPVLDRGLSFNDSHDGSV